LEISSIDVGINYLAVASTIVMTAVNHEVSKDLIEFAAENDVSVIGMEDLTGIQTRTVNRVSKEFRCEHSNWHSGIYRLS